MKPSNYYNEISKGYDELHLEEQKRKILLIKKYIKTSKEQEILDVGGGTGILSELIEGKITNLEPSKKMLEEGLKKRTYTPINGEAEKTEELFAENQFDITFCITAAHHIQDIEKALKGIQKVTKNNAYIIITLLKKAQNTQRLIKKITQRFLLEKQIEEQTDIILILKNNKTKNN
jgi:ubiquinone/menaquinone biosynthesis C-methylase UbiE